MMDKQNRYAIRKLTVGAASVLIGFAFMSNAGSTKAATVNPTQPNDTVKADENATHDKPAADLQLNTHQTAKAEKSSAVSQPTVPVEQTISSTPKVEIKTQDTQKVENKVKTQEVTTNKAGTTDFFVAQPGRRQARAMVAAAPTTTDDQAYASQGIDKTNTDVAYLQTKFDNVSKDGTTITLDQSHWFSANILSNPKWQPNQADPYAGKYLLTFQDPEFAKNIASISMSGGAFNKHQLIPMDNNTVWALNAIDGALQPALIGVNQNSTITIKLKDGSTLTSLGYADKAIPFSSVMTLNNGKISNSTISTGVILSTTPYDKIVAANPGGAIPDQGFIDGWQYDDVRVKDGSIDSIHRYKPTVRFGTADANWVLYINEQVPKEVLPYIDTNNVQIVATDANGVPQKGTTPMVVSVDPQTGMVNTGNDPKYSLKDDNSSTHLTDIRNILGNNVFTAPAGGSGYYTIKYQLKPGVTDADFLTKMK